MEHGEYCDICVSAVPPTYGIKRCITFKIPGGFGEYKQKASLMMAASEPFDLVFTAHWCNPYYDAIEKELYEPLDELIAQHAPTIGAELKDYFNSLDEQLAWMTFLQDARNMTPSALLGFNPDLSGLKNEFAKCNAIWSTVFQPIRNGLVDPDAEIPNARKTLTAAGYDKIIEELNRQLDDFKASKALPFLRK